jgi:hypothetical protein
VIHEPRSFRFGRKDRRNITYLVFLGCTLLLILPSRAAQAPPVPGAKPESSRAGAPRLPHPSIFLKDDTGRNVLETRKAISTRQTCGADCHEYDFIADSMHFQQGKNEMDRKILDAQGMPAFNTSPGMFGKFSILPNRQLTHAGISDPSDVDMSQPE